MVVCGVVGWRRKLERRENKGQIQYLHASETLEKRTHDKLLEKTSWYKESNKRKLEDKDSKYKYHPPTKKRRNGNKDRDTKKNNKGEKENATTKKIKSVMFVPYTRHSELAARLRDSEVKWRN